MAHFSTVVDLMIKVNDVLVNDTTSASSSHVLSVNSAVY